MKDLLVVSSLAIGGFDVLLLIGKAALVIAAGASIFDVILLALLAFSAGIVLTSGAWLWKMTRE